MIRLGLNLQSTNKVSDEIARFDPSSFKRIEIAGREDRGTKDSIGYVELRSPEVPLKEKAGNLRVIDWGQRMISEASMTGKEFIDKMGKIDLN